MFIAGEIDGFVIDAPATDKFISKYPCISYQLADPIVTFNYGIVYAKEADRNFINNLDLKIFGFRESPE